MVFGFHILNISFRYWSTGGGEDPPPAPRLFWFEKLSGIASGLSFDHAVVPKGQRANDAGENGRRQCHHQMKAAIFDVSFLLMVCFSPKNGGRQTSRNSHHLMKGRESQRDSGKWPRPARPSAPGKQHWHRGGSPKPAGSSFFAGNRSGKATAAGSNSLEPRTAGAGLDAGERAFYFCVFHVNLQLSGQLPVFILRYVLIIIATIKVVDFCK